MTDCARKISQKRVLTASVAVQLCLGGIYAWSTFVAPLQTEHGFSIAQTQSIFGATIAVFSLALVPAGRLLVRYGPRRIMAVAGILFASGYLIAAASDGNSLLVILGIGVIGGVGIGFGYVCPLAAAISWYPRRRGLVLGCVMAGFGAGAIVLSAASAFAFSQGVGVLQWFACLGGGYGLILLLCSRWLVLPPMQAPAADAAGACPRFWRDRNFCALVLGMFCGTFSGLLVIGNLKPIGLSWGVSPGAATAAISLFAAGNVMGRIGWGWLADRWGSRQMIPLMLVAGSASLAVWQLAASSGMVAFLAAVILIAFSFGGCFILFAAQVSGFYGAARLPLIYPWIFLAYGLAALVGPMIGGWLYDTLQDYRHAIYIASAVCAAGGIAFPIMTRKPPATACVRTQEVSP